MGRGFLPLGLSNTCRQVDLAHRPVRRAEQVWDKPKQFRSSRASRQAHSLGHEAVIGTAGAVLAGMTAVGGKADGKRSSRGPKRGQSRLARPCVFPASGRRRMALTPMLLSKSSNSVRQSCTSADASRSLRRSRPAFAAQARYSELRKSPHYAELVKRYGGSEANVDVACAG